VLDDFFYYFFHCLLPVIKSLSSGEATLYPRRSLYKKGEILKILTKILLLIGESFRSLQVKSLRILGGHFRKKEKY
jgi:hypothetical protein